ncbi:MAG TPA: hypothetical protein VFE91_03440, partial [Nitrososphaerales archaeon]|nr:hypothetical protein [Nitrososphaerales archaeon]
EGCKEAITEGKLWDLVEEKSMVHPRLRMAFGEFVKLSPWLSEGTPAQKDHGVLVRGEDDRLRPELIIAAERLGRSARRSSRTALVLKPGEQISKKKGKRTPGDVYKMNEVLGHYPAELDFVYPFAQTVSAANDVSDNDMKGAVKRLKAAGYREVVTSRRQTRSLMSRRNRRAPSASPR